MMNDDNFLLLLFFFFFLPLGDTIVVGGNVPAKGGRPNIALKSYEVCPGQTFDDEDKPDSDEETKVKKEKKRL